MQDRVDSLCEPVERVIREAGTILNRLFRSPGLIVECKKDNSYVCNADIVSEEFLKKELHTILPEASFFTEESGKSGESDFCWVIDPLDGTTNFIHGLPYFCISVALTYKHEPVFGTVYNSLCDDYFFAQKGKGAYLNNNKISIKEPQALSKSIFIVGIPAAKDEGSMAVIDSIPKIAKKAFAFRHFGAIALDLAYVAHGGIDGIFFPRLPWWDIAAGMLLVQEAGGTVTDFGGRPITRDYQSFVAGNDQIHEALLDLLKNGTI